MKYKIAITIIFFTVVSTVLGLQTNENVSLLIDWKFKTGDSSLYSKPEFDDQSWSKIQIGRPWETQGYSNYNGTAWYRAHLVIPSSLKDNNKYLQSVRISLGQIADSDVTYFNGKKIGATNSRNVERTYLIPFDAINWDKENVIAIRVHNKSGNGGLYSGKYIICDAALSEVVLLTTHDIPSEFTADRSKEVKKSIDFNLKVPVKKLDGTLKIKIYEPIQGKTIYSDEQNIAIGSQANTTYSFIADIKEPGRYRIDYSFSSKFYQDTAKYNSLFSYIKADRNNEKFVEPIVKHTVPNKANSLALENIKLYGYLNERVYANIFQRLLKIDETGILEAYYNRPGKQTWVGEYTGKYLHAASRAWRYSKNEQLKTQMDRIVDILIACQNKDGYLGTYLPADYWTNWDVWAHKYNMLGLLSYYSVTGCKPALEASIKMGDLLCRTFGEKENQLNIIKSSGHVGMASTSVLEPMTELYRYTGDNKYLDFCYYIVKAYEDGPKIISTLNTVGRVDKVANAKAYEMMSNLTGIVKMYQVTGDENLIKAADTAWNDISKYRLYITGTASKAELFQDDFVFPASNDDHMGEGCVTTTWLQFSQSLYNLTGDCKYMDEIEKTIYNHLLAAENPGTGCVSYYTALQDKKPYRCSINAHCCLASIPRGIAAIPELVYTKSTDNNVFCINMFTAGEFSDNVFTKKGKEVPVKCVIDSKFPEEGKVIITLNSAKKANFKLALRVPEWCNKFVANIDGKSIEGTPGKYLYIDRQWNLKTTIQISFDLNVQTLPGGKSYPDCIAVKTGPQILSVDQALNPELKDLDKITIGSVDLELLPKALLPNGWVGSQIYRTKAYYDGAPIDLKLVPFAEASQTEGDIRTWIKKNKKD